MMQLIFFIFGLMVLGTGLKAEETETDPRTRIKINIAGSVAKDLVIIGGGDSTFEPAKSASLGGMLSFEFPIIPLIAIGALGRGLYELEKKGPSYYDIDGFLKLQFELMKAAVSANLYLTVPAGFSLMPWKDTFKEVGKGFNLGALVGANFYFGDHFGIFAEVGYLYRYIFAKLDVTNSDRTLQFHELAANIGLSFAL